MPDDNHGHCMNRVCGIKPVGCTMFGMVGAADNDKRAKWLDTMAHLGRRARQIVNASTLPE